MALLLDLRGSDFTMMREGFKVVENQESDQEVITLLDRREADVLNITRENGLTLLNAAASSGHIEVVKLLLDKGIDMAIVNANGLTPLNAAATNGHV